MSDILKHAKLDDPLQNATGGYAPDADTPTHFFGREATEKIAAQTKTATKKKAAPVEPKTIEVKVAPGVVIAYEDGGPGERNSWDGVDPMYLEDDEYDEIFQHMKNRMESVDDFHSVSMDFQNTFDAFMADPRSGQ